METLDLLNEIEISADLKLFYQTDEWEHPEEEKPSENKFFQSLAKAIELDDTNLIQLNNPNTHWSNWTWSDFEKQKEVVFILLVLIYNPWCVIGSFYIIF
jgi:hypothetical protein